MTKYTPQQIVQKLRQSAHLFHSLQTYRFAREKLHARAQGNPEK